MIHHVFSSFTPRDVATRKRQEVAHETWAVQPWIEIPILDSELPRMWEEEGRAFPFVTDILNRACAGLNDDAIMVYTNADLCVRSNCALLIAAALQDTDALYSMRRDFNEPFHEPIPDDVIPRGDNYAGSDLYAFRVGWWEKNKAQFPDMIISYELWDAVLRQLITETNPDREVMLPNISYHQRHSGPTHWENPKNRYRLKGQIHNLRLGSMWLRMHGVDPAKHGVPRKAGGFAL